MNITDVSAHDLTAAVRALESEYGELLEVVRVEPGHRPVLEDGTCPDCGRVSRFMLGPGPSPSQILQACYERADSVITLAYGPSGYYATYGVLNGEAGCWAS